MAFHFLQLLFVAATLCSSLISAASCNQDNCMRAFINNQASAATVCSDFFASPPTPTYPSFASPCSSSAAKISSACSCLATTPPSSGPSSPTSPTTYPSTCPTVPPATVTITSVTTVSPACSASASATPPACSCNNMLGNPSFESATPSPWRVVIDDPAVHWSISPSQDIPGGAFDGEWALEFSWDAGVTPSQMVGIYQSVPIPPCCFGPQLKLSWAILSPENTCEFSMYWNVIFPSSPTGQIPSFPWEAFEILPDNEWQRSWITWSFEEVQDDLQVEILLACANSNPVWIDLVTVNLA